MKMKTPKLKVGDWVEIRSKEEILQTLDSSGQLENMPFMPEMLDYCGRRFRVYKRAHKTCDTVFPIRSRWVRRTVHLETRCDGAAHGGCQAGCLLYWKEAWLKRVDGDAPAPAPEKRLIGIAPATEALVWSNAKTIAPNGRDRYICQATQLPYFTTHLSSWDIRQYLEDYRSGNVGLWRLFCALVYSLFFNLSQAGIGLGRPMRWFYDKFRFVWGGSLYPRRVGRIPAGKPTPTSSLNVQPGELVRVKSHEEILKTLNVESRNRGMIWDAEMVPYCGGAYRVLKRVDRIVNEQTGEMQDMKNPCIILDTVVCRSRYSHCRMLCPRSIYPYWREIWLERVTPASGNAPVQSSREVSAGVEQLTR
jgi:hypothetical protein